MYAVVKTGGKQYVVRPNDELKVEKLEAEANSEVILNDVLMVAADDKVTIGTPLVKNAKVKAQVLEHGKHKKVRIIKFKRRKHHDKHQGHRQLFTKIKVLEVLSGS